jgi:HD-GYP domain-containing protein (c-di-GMP phosphodiesterase class II)
MRSAVQTASLDSAHTELRSAFNAVEESLSTLPLNEVTAGSETADQLQTLLEEQTENIAGAMIVDRSWHVVWSIALAGDAKKTRIVPGDVLRWQLHGTEQANEGPTWGTLGTDAGPQLACAIPLTYPAGYFVIYRSASGVPEAANALLSSVSGVSALVFLWVGVLASIALYMIFASYHERVDKERAASARKALRQTQNLVRTRDAVIFGLAKLADSRDTETGDHLERITAYCVELASALRRTPQYREVITPAYIRLIGISSALHDIGKVGISDNILLKPGPLTPEERIRMQKHTTIGGDCLRGIEQRLGTSNFLEMAREIALHHHERWDGSGYPEGLVGQRIPLAARIVAVADVYDALTSKRVYKDAIPHEESIEHIRSQAGKHFDPDVVDACVSVENRIRAIARQYGNDVPPQSRPEPAAAAHATSSGTQPAPVGSPNASDK